MTKDLLKVKIAECFQGRGCKIDFDPQGHYGWLIINCGSCIFPDDIDRLRKFLYVSNISASVDYDHLPHLLYVEIYCSYEDIID